MISSCDTVSYTHLDVYKRQEETLAKGTAFCFLPTATNQRMEELWLWAKTE